MSLLRRKNDLYVRHLVGGFRKKVRKANVLRGIMAYRAAVKATWQDSGQFADNWFMKFGVTSRRERARFNRGQQHVGLPGDQRSAQQQGMRVMTVKLREHEINNNNHFSTTLFARLTKTVGRFPIITIYNPLYDKAVSTGHNTPHAYWYYAAANRPGFIVEQAVELAVKKATARAQQLIKSGAW